MDLPPNVDRMQNTQPLVHALFEPSTGTWQYIVADQYTRHCVIINPTHHHDPKEVVVPTTSPDAILKLVQLHEYVVDWLLETSPSANSHTAVYYMRMQLLERQGFAPRTCGGSNVSSFQRVFARRYGSRSNFTTTFDKELRDGDIMDVGQMRVGVLEVDGPATKHLGYVIGESLFGFHYFTHLSGLARLLPDSDITALRLRHVWLSLAKILSFSPECRIYFDNTASVEPGGVPYTSVHDNRRCNQFAEMSEQEFIRYWKAQLNPAFTAESDRPKSKRDKARKNNRLALGS